MTKLNRRELLLTAGSAMAGALLPSRADAPARYRLMVFSNPAEGREAEYNHWYDTIHLPDVVSVPGFVRARRMVMAPVQFHQSPPLAKYLALFEIETNDIAAVFAEVQNRIKTGRTRMSNVFSRVGAHSRTYRMIGEPLMAQGLAPLSARQDASDGFHFVFNTPIAGREDAFNDWYDHEHLPDMLTVPGFVEGERAALSKVQLVSDPTAAPYLAIFRFDANDLLGVNANFAAVVPHLRMRQVMSGADGYTMIPHGPVLIGDEIRKARKT